MERSFGTRHKYTGLAAADSYRPKKNNNMDLLAACMANSSQGKDAGVLFRLKYSIHQNIGIGCDTSS